MLKINTSLPENCRSCFAYSASTQECRITGTAIPSHHAQLAVCDNCPLECNSDPICKNEGRDSIKVKDFLKITNYPLVFVWDVTNWQDTIMLILESNEECEYPTHLLSYVLLEHTITDIAIGKIDDHLVQILEILDDNI